MRGRIRRDRAGLKSRQSLKARSLSGLYFRNKTPMFHRRDVICSVVAVLPRTIAIRKLNDSRREIRFPA
jgi:hypothetical protein